MEESTEEQESVKEKKGNAFAKREVTKRMHSRGKTEGSYECNAMYYVQIKLVTMRFFFSNP